jgi:hypothetical protein
MLAAIQPVLCWTPARLAPVCWMPHTVIAQERSHISSRKRGSEFAEDPWAALSRADPPIWAGSLPGLDRLCHGQILKKICGSLFQEAPILHGKEGNAWLMFATAAPPATQRHTKEDRAGCPSALTEKNSKWQVKGSWN